MKQVTAAFGLLILSAAVGRADGPADNIPSVVRQVPPPGIEISPADRERLEAGVAKLQTMIGELRQRNEPQIDTYLPDVEVFARAVDQAVRFNEMFAEADVRRADELLGEGLRRADRLAKGDDYWTKQKGLVVRGFRSKLDDTVQPYGLVIPPTYRDDIPYRYRTDIWFHGRGESSVELQFIHQRMHDPGQYQPEDTIVLHPFGRYSNAFKFAGEVDVFEALDHAKANYRIDDDRISVRGFSMGGAACWHFAVHYADRWFAANPGAGFSETPLFLQTFQGEVLQPTWWEKTLWQWYDCPPWVTNLGNVPVIAYSGELDRQKQAADAMAAAYEEIHDWDRRWTVPEQGKKRVPRPSSMRRSLVHVIGPDTAHKIATESKTVIASRLDALAEQSQGTIPMTVNMVTSTLAYDRQSWVRIRGLTRHWLTGYVSARIEPPNRIYINTSAVTDFELTFGPGDLPSWFVRTPDVWWDLPDELRDLPGVEDRISDEPPLDSDGSWGFRMYLKPQLFVAPSSIGDEWIVGTPPWERRLHKRHGLQGPIDDALMNSFLFVVPGGTCRHPQVEEWTQAELKHAVTQWRQQMRGDVRIKADVDLTEEDIARHNLILWGDPASNRVTGRIADQLPIRWGEREIIVGERRFDAEHHAPILIYPNPLNPKKYVVLNSSFTYREYDYLNNARQTPKLPDWAVVDLRVKPDSRWPGKIVDADFFDEKWQLQKPYGERMAAAAEH